MVLDARCGRFLKVFPLVAVLAVSACGADLGKSNFARTTVPAAAGTGGTSADGPITDAAVASDVLRLVKPCQFLTKDALSSLGTAADDPRASSTEFAGCGNSVNDPGGKRISFNLQLGSGSIPNKEATTGVVGGLPLRQSKSEGLCEIAAVTVQPKFGIDLSVNYSGGDPCRAAQTVLEAVVKKLHETPDKYQPAQGTLLTQDPCTVLDASAVTPVVPDAKSVADGLHSCQWGTGPAISVGFRPGLPPIEGDGYQKADVGGGVAAFKKQGTTTTPECDVEWKHRTWEGDQVEIAYVKYTNYGGKADSDDACGKAVTVAKALVNKLPKA